VAAVFYGIVAPPWSGMLVGLIAPPRPPWCRAPPSLAPTFGEAFGPSVSC
jgi:hypothetical protein